MWKILNFAFSLPIFLFSISQLGLGEEEVDLSKVTVLKVDFNMTFFCGPYVGAEGRLFVRLRKGELASEYQVLLDTVINREMNGHFAKPVYLPLDVSHSHSVETFFRTNCYILNRIGECCAHEFKFTSSFGILGAKTFGDDSWISSDLDRMETSSKKCCKKKSNGEINEHGKDCQFSFHTKNRHPLAIEPTNRIDLRQLLLDPDSVKKKDGLAMAFTSRRLCSPIHDNKENEAFANWTICAEPDYGWSHPSFQWANMARYEKRFGEEGEKGNCKCNNPNKKFWTAWNCIKHA